MKEKLRRILPSHQKRKIINKKLAKTAVLIPLFFKEKEEEYHILFTQRSNHVTHHKGQVSFPGGAHSEIDSSLLDTALRESWEEIGLEAKDVEILGELDDITTITGFIISPFVAFIPHPYEFKKNNDEIDEIFDVPLSALLDKANFKETYQVINDEPVTVYSYEYEGQVIWGATARILKQFLEIWQSMSGAQ